VTDLGTLGGLTSGATGVNDQGTVVGASLVSCPTCTPKQTPSHAFRLQSGQLTDLGTLGGKSSAAKAINNNDWIVGVMTGNASYATLCRAAPEELGPWADQYRSGINKKSQIVGQSDVIRGGSTRSSGRTAPLPISVSCPPATGVSRRRSDSGLIVGRLPHQSGDLPCSGAGYSYDRDPASCPSSTVNRFSGLWSQQPGQI
jgi:probable HAF family extracellular repeat protein